ncbi:hypothetical protein V6N13_130058 [Hibiscus sabdariffa]
MVNPSSISNPSSDQVNGDVGFGTSGRPPDIVIVDGKPPGSPTNQGLQSVIGRGQREKLVNFLGSDSVQAVVDVEFEQASGHEGIQRPVGHPPSFKDKLIGVKRSENGGSTIKDLDVEVKDEDYGHMKESCGVPVVAANKEDNSMAQRNPQELYGPWMQVVNRKRRNVSTMNNSGLPSRGAKPMNIEGSRFDILSQEPENALDLADASLSTGVLEREVEVTVMGSKKGRAKAGKETSAERGMREEVKFGEDNNGRFRLRGGG